jgi:hypothetical protein
MLPSHVVQSVFPKHLLYVIICNEIALHGLMTVIKHKEKFAFLLLTKSVILIFVSSSQIFYAVIYFCCYVVPDLFYYIFDFLTFKQTRRSRARLLRFSLEVTKQISNTYLHRDLNCRSVFTLNQLFCSYKRHKSKLQ